MRCVMFENWKRQREQQRMGRYLERARAGYGQQMDRDVDLPSYWGQVARGLFVNLSLLAALTYAALAWQGM